jgi:phage terminase small subunit
MSPKESPTPKAKIHNLNPRQARFVEEYLVDRNATQAAIRSGYSPASAASQASELLKLPKIAAALESAVGAQSRRTQITADAVLTELYRLATVDVSKAYDVDGNLLPLDKVPEEVRRAMQGIDIAKTGEKVARFHSKEGPLMGLAKHFGLLRDKVELTGEGGEPLQIVVNTYKDGEEK